MKSKIDKTNSTIVYLLTNDGILINIVVADDKNDSENIKFIIDNHFYKKFTINNKNKIFFS